MKKQMKKSINKKSVLNNGCPACDLIHYKSKKYKQCKKCNHLYVGDTCENCNSYYSKSKEGNKK